MPSLTKPLMLRISPTETDNWPLVPFLASGGVFPRAALPFACIGRGSPPTGIPNRSRSESMSDDSTGAVLQSIPIIPDEDDDYREARA